MCVMAVSNIHDIYGIYMHVSLAGATQPEKVVDNYTYNNADGLWSRFVLVFPVIVHLRKGERLLSDGVGDLWLRYNSSLKR